MENSPRCLHCQHLITRDIGYSEWTITGSEFKCDLGCFKDWEFCEEWNEQIPSLKEIADKCEHYFAGSPENHSIDCDIEDGNCTCGAKE